MKKSLNTFILFILAALFGCNNADKAQLLYTKSGFDWSLPSEVELTPHTGFTWIWGDWTWVNDWYEIYPQEDTGRLHFA